MRRTLTQTTLVLTAAVALVVWLLVVSVHAQSDTPKPAPEMKKLEALVGNWSYEGEQFDPPLPGLPYGGAGKYSGTFTTRFVLNGFFLQDTVEDNNPSGKTTIMAMTGYDAAAKCYVGHAFTSDGTITVGTSTLDGQTFTGNSTMTAASGKKVLLKTVVTYSSDWSRYTATVDNSVDDGKTWKPWWKEEGRKVEK
jgi:hypothetical protein